MIKEEGHFIIGISKSGKKFRPSDWVERIATSCASFDVNHRLHYNPDIMPAKHRGQSCLFVANRLAINEPDNFNFVMQFAESNQLLVIQSGQPDLPEPPFELESAA